MAEVIITVLQMANLQLPINCFLPRYAMLAQYMLSSCVRPSVARQCCTKIAKHMITQTMPYDRSGTLVF